MYRKDKVFGCQDKIARQFADKIRRLLQKDLTEKGIACEPIRRDSVTGELLTFIRDPDGLPIEVRE